MKDKFESPLRRMDRLLDIARRQMEFELNVVNMIASDNAAPILAPIYDGAIIQEGLLGERPFAGSLIHDEIEKYACNLASALFEADHVNLQPHSCSQANQAVYAAFLNPGDRVLALEFSAGGHLTHGMNNNFSGRFYDFHFYGLDSCWDIDYDGALKLARTILPKLIVCGSSSFPRLFDFNRLRVIADTVGAKLHFDLSHEAGLIAARVIANPVPVADAVTMSLDKTMRGPFGGIILCKSEHATRVDKAVHPGTQSSFPVQKMFQAARCFIAAESHEYRQYATNALAFSTYLSGLFDSFSPKSLVGFPEKHFFLIDTREFGLSGEEAERELESISILCNRQTLPFDNSKRMSEASGIRLGTSWIASRGFNKVDVEELFSIILAKLCRCSTEETQHLKERVARLCQQLRPRDVWSSLVNELH